MTRMTKQFVTGLVLVSFVLLIPAGNVLPAEDQVIIHTVLEKVPEADIAWVKNEAEKAVDKIGAFLGVSRDQPIRIQIIEDVGPTRINPQETIELPIRLVKCRGAGVVREVARVMVGHKDNKFFWEGIALYFQETYGKALHPLNPTGEALDDVIRRQSDRLIPIYELAKDWGRTKKFTTTEEFPLAHMEAGSFTNYLVETCGEAKMRELHDSSSLNYKEIYGKDLKELGAEWKKFVLEQRSSQPRKLPRILGVHFSKEKGQDSLLVYRMFPGMMAERIGLIPGDRLLAVDGETFSGDDTDQEAACRIRRIMSQKEWGDSITLTILREGVKKEITVQFQWTTLSP
jgi:hypothetical protein